MTSKKLFYLLIAALVLVNASGAAVFVLGNKQITKQNDELSRYKLESTALEEVQRSLVSAKKDINTYKDIESIAKTVVPQEKDQAKTVREIVKLAEESNIPISSVTFPTSSLGAKATAGPSTATQQQAGTITQTQKVTGLNNVERLEITVTSDTTKPVPYSNFIRFLDLLEKNRRTSQVGSINIQPDPKNRNLLTFSLILNVYIKK